MKNVKKTNFVQEKEDLLMEAILEFYRKHPGYRISQSEFFGLICALSQQAMSDV